MKHEAISNMTVHDSLSIQAMIHEPKTYSLGIFYRYSWETF